MIRFRERRQSFPSVLVTFVPLTKDVVVTPSQAVEALGVLHVSSVSKHRGKSKASDGLHANLKHEHFCLGLN
jgi:hypothetical protein